MEYTMQERAARIVEACLRSDSTDPVAIFCAVVGGDFMRMHGPEHHVLDGACILTAYRNAGGAIDLPEALGKLVNEGLRMPGAACGLWGVCGAVSSIGAALAIIEGTGPLSTDGSWGRHMLYTAAALKRMGEVNGPRCCKRDAYIAMGEAVRFIHAQMGVQLGETVPVCTMSGKNAQCIRTRCPYYPK